MSGFVVYRRAADAGGRWRSCCAAAAAACRAVARTGPLPGIGGRWCCAGGAALLYPVWSKWNWNEPERGGRLAGGHGGSPGAPPREAIRMTCEGWLLLGKSYAVDRAVSRCRSRAYQRADRLAEGTQRRCADRTCRSPGRCADAERPRRAGRAAVRAGAGAGPELRPRRFSTAPSPHWSATSCRWPRERFERLLQGNPPPEVRRIIEEQVQRTGRAAARGRATGAPASCGFSPAAAPASAQVSVPLRITLDAKVADKARGRRTAVRAGAHSRPARTAACGQAPGGAVSAGRRAAEHRCHDWRHWFHGRPGDRDRSPHRQWRQRDFAQR